MSEPQPAGGPAYTCPMHKDVRQATPGKCPHCGMALLPEGTRFAIIRHIMASPMHIAFMAAVMIGLTAISMMIWR
jgi:hypothetical protein